MNGKHSDAAPAPTEDGIVELDLDALVNAIPDRGEWWKSNTGEVYRGAARTLMDHGLEPQTAVEFLREIYQATASEFGE